MMKCGYCGNRVKNCVACHYNERVGNFIVEHRLPMCGTCYTEQATVAAMSKVVNGD